MNRRDVISSLATGATLALAGCSSSSDPAEDRNPNPDGSDGNGEMSEPGGDLGVTQVTQGNVRITMKDAFTASTLVHNGEYAKGENGVRFLLVDVQVRNNADGVKSIPVHSDLSVRNTDNIRQKQVTDGDSHLLEPVSEMYTPPTSFGGDAEIDPGTQVRGWVAYSVSTDDTEFTIELPELLTKDNDTVAWDVTVPEETGVVLEETVDMPTDPRSGRPVQVTAAVANAGTRTGRVSRNYVVSKYVGENISQSIESGVAAGERKEITLEFTPAKTGPYAISSTIREYGSVDVDPREFAFGETWDLATGLNITVSDPLLTDSITYIDTDEDTVQTTPSDGNRFLVFDYEAESDDEHYWNPLFVAESGGEEVNTLDKNEVRYLADGSSYVEELVSPIAGEPTSLGGVADWPDGFSGPMVMEVPSSFSMSDLTIHLQDDDVDSQDRYAATWQ